MNGLKAFLFVCLGIVCCLVSCTPNPVPKPRPYLKLDYPEAVYANIQQAGPYHFELSSAASIDFSTHARAKIRYPELKASIHLSYHRAAHQLEPLLQEVDRRILEHRVKADAIYVSPYEDLDKKVYALLYSLEGNVASPIQFRATDSVKQVLSGALYFYARPNYDSLLPAIKYIEKDIKHLIETLEWQ